ncbi:hypothetical protein HNO88_000116 [Novosphingobium chloroacetimidivorans]|uniref:Twin-arginine translocation pathway signal protein n=1 Tax=Novosphingobium chloroacetimidivorans TaxID=1428314 RepID=A0A7W7NV14_9SPHN|nr:twin-arginine translocation pathway signal protein [Novosphingobium chloroacetimidivorans]MBB4856819.1 hypothetical protein [Novosphingobium chloroacetimidivorans]
MTRRLAGTWLSSAMLMISAPTAHAQAPATTRTPQTSAPATGDTARHRSPLVAPDFKVPVLARGPGFKLVPLGPDLVQVDYDAYMSSIEHLQKTFSRSTNWPTAGITSADAMKDMQGEAGRFRSRTSFAYGVLTPDAKRERGSVYVSPSPVPGYDAMVRLWVTKDEFDRGFDAELYKWVVAWVRQDWPFAKVAYPGRSIDWATWDALVAQGKARKTAQAH